MSRLLQIMILIGAMATVVYILHRLRKLRVRMEDTIFWIFLAVVLIILAVVPEVSYFFSDLLSIQSPVNLIFLFVIALLMEKLFTVSMKLSLLEEKITVLAAETALRCGDIERNDEAFQRESQLEEQVKRLEKEVAQLKECQKPEKKAE